MRNPLNVSLIRIALLAITLLHASLAGSLLVSNNMGNRILSFDSVSGASQGVFATSVLAASDLAVMPNGDVLATGGGFDGVVRFHGSTGASLGTFAATNSNYGLLAYGPTTTSTLRPVRTFYDSTGRLEHSSAASPARASR